MDNQDPMATRDVFGPDRQGIGDQQIRGQAYRHQVRRFVPGTAFVLIGSKILPKASDVITVNGLPLCKRLMIVIDLIASGSINLNGLTFNNDTAANYARQTQNNAFAAADTTAASTLRLDGGDATENRFVVIEISNLRDQEKLGMARMIESGGAELVLPGPFSTDEMCNQGLFVWPFDHAICVPP